MMYQSSTKKYIDSKERRSNARRCDAVEGCVMALRLRLRNLLCVLLVTPLSWCALAIIPRGYGSTGVACTWNLFRLDKICCSD